MIKMLRFMIILQGIAFELVSLLVAMFLCWNQTMMFMKRLSNLFWRNLNIMWSLVFLLNLPQIRHLKRECKSISIVSKLTLVIIECLFHNYFSFHSRLIFYVLCRDIQPDHFQFVSFYVLRDFPNPPSNKYLLKYYEDIS